MGAGTLELLGHQLPGQDEEQMAFPHQPSQCSARMFLCSVRPLIFL